VQDFALIV